MLKFPTMSPDMGWRLRVLGGLCYKSFFSEEGWLFIPVSVSDDEPLEEFMQDLKQVPNQGGNLSNGMLGPSR